MSSVHEQTPAPADGAVARPASRPKAPMSASQRAFLAGVREEILEPVNAIVILSEMLLNDAADLGQEAFLADLQKIHASGKHLREMVDEFLDPRTLAGQLADGAFSALQSRVRHDMLNALNPVVNYCEMWLEDAQAQFLPGFLPDLQRLHS